MTKRKITCVALCLALSVCNDEACDDNNQDDGDGCDSACQVESGWTCQTGNPSFLFNQMTFDPPMPPVCRPSL